MAAVVWDNKDPNDVDDFSIDWTNQLNGETLQAAVWTIVSAAGAAIVSSSVTSPFASVRISGGTENETMVLLCRITTNTGRQLDQTAKLGIVSQ